MAAIVSMVAAVFTRFDKLIFIFTFGRKRSCHKAMAMLLVVEGDVIANSDKILLCTRFCFAHRKTPKANKEPTSLC